MQPTFSEKPPATSVAGGFSYFRPSVGPAIEGGTLVPTGQLVRPAGASVSFPGRPVDVVLSGDGKWLFAKDNRGVVVIDAKAWKVIQQLPFPKGKGGGSMHGLAVRDNRLYATTAQRWLHEAEIEEGQLTWKRAIVLAGPDGKGEAHATGIAVSRDGKTAWVCLSRNNSLGVVDLAKGKLLREIPVGVAPYAVVVNRSESTAFVSNWVGWWKRSRRVHSGRSR